MNEYKVLDKGYVKYFGHFGDDNTPLIAARQSTQNPTGIDIDKDDKLREYLWSKGHISPFHFCNVLVEIKLPIAIMRQIARHTGLRFNEFSARYSESIDEYYIPDFDNIKPQSKSNKQLSEGILSESVRVEAIKHIQESYDKSRQEYKTMLDNGVARETARFVQPVGNYTKGIFTGNLRDWLFFLNQRLDDDAQWECREYAKAIADIIRRLFPKTYSVFDEYTLNSVTLSKTEVEILKEVLIEGIDDYFWSNLNDKKIDVINNIIKKLGD